MAIGVWPLLVMQSDVLVYEGIVTQEKEGI